MSYVGGWLWNIWAYYYEVCRQMYVYAWCEKVVVLIDTVEWLYMAFVRDGWLRMTSVDNYAWYLLVYWWFWMRLVDMHDASRKTIFNDTSGWLSMILVSRWMISNDAGGWLCMTYVYIYDCLICKNVKESLWRCCSGIRLTAGYKYLTDSFQHITTIFTRGDGNICRDIAPVQISRLVGFRSRKNKHCMPYFANVG